MNGLRTILARRKPYGIRANYKPSPPRDLISGPVFDDFEDVNLHGLFGEHGFHYFIKGIVDAREVREIAVILNYRKPYKRITFSVTRHYVNELGYELEK